MMTTTDDPDSNNQQQQGGLLLLYVVTAPIMDKLLAMLGTPSSSPQPMACKEYVEEEKPATAEQV
jgi:hypothetical protein